MIQFLSVTKEYIKDHPVILNVSFHIKRGEFILLNGKSGSGKTTILDLIYMKEVPTSGKVMVEKYNSRKISRINISKLRSRVGMIFQDFHILRDRNIFENVAFPLYITGGTSTKVIKKKVLKVLAYTGLSHKSLDMPNNLSAGEQQRMCIARALIQQPAIILADEPLGNLDEENSLEIIKLLKNINDSGASVIFSTHQKPHKELLSYRKLNIEGGTIKV